MMPKFGNITSPVREIVQDIHTIADMGFDFVELNFAEPEGSPDVYRRKAKKIKNAIRERNLFAYAHATGWADLAGLDKNVRLAWIGHCKNLIDISSMIGIKKLNFHAHTVGIHKTHSSKELAMKEVRIKNFVSSFRVLVKYAKKKNIAILYENTWEIYEDFESIFRRISGLELNVDIAHAFIKGGMKSVAKFLSLGNKIEHMHISDNKGKNDDHLLLGKGLIDFSSVVKTLKKINYDRTMTFEIFEGGRRSPQRSLKYFKKLWQRVKP